MSEEGGVRRKVGKEIKRWGTKKGGNGRCSPQGNGGKLIA